MAIDLGDLESKARAATPGPWRHSLGEVLIGDVWWHAEDWTHDQGGQSANVRFIAAANPTAVLALIARIRDLEQALGTALRDMDDPTYNTDHLEAALTNTPRCPVCAFSGWRTNTEHCDCPHGERNRKRDEQWAAARGKVGR